MFLGYDLSHEIKQNKQHFSKMINQTLWFRVAIQLFCGKVDTAKFAFAFTKFLFSIYFLFYFE